MLSSAETRDRLAREDSNYRRLAHKHEEYAKRLTELQNRRYLSEDEKLEEVKLKKMKLVLKDQMEDLIQKSSA